MTLLWRTDRSAQTLKAVRPNAGVTVLYRRRLDARIKAMHDSVGYWLAAAYKANEPEALAQDTAVLIRALGMALDEAPADALRKVVDGLGKRWNKKFDDMAKQLAEYFAQDIQDRSDLQLKRILRDGGYTVRFRMSPAQKDVFKATVNANVDLIKSIPRRYMTQVAGMVQRSVQTGRNLGRLTAELEREYGVTRRRAALIARDQNNKATSAMNHVRQQELGIHEAIWQHSHAGKEPRPTHVKMDGKRYDITKGMWDADEGEYVFPGQLINCRCTSRPVVPGFS